MNAIRVSWRTKVRCVTLLLTCGLAAEAQITVQSWSTTADLAQTLTPCEPLVFERGAGTADIELDPQRTYQTMLGMGSSLEHTTCANLWRLDPATRAEVVEKLVSPEIGIGMSTMRICIGTPDFTGEEWYTYDDMPPGQTDPELAHFSIEKDRAYIIPVLKLALEKNPNLLFYASPWSPPGWMKTCGDLIGGHLYPRYYGVYAQYFVKFIEAYRAEGIPIHAVTVQNEPGVNKRDDVLSWWYPSCQWSLVVDEDTWWPVPLEVMGHAERDFIRDHLGPTFRDANIATEIWCFDHNLNNLWYPRNILSDPEAARYVSGTAFHPYAGKASDMGAFKAEFPDKDVYLSEGSMFGVRGAVRIIDFLRNWARSYNAWVTVADSNGEPNNGPFEADKPCVTIGAADGSVTYNFEYYMYGQFMKFVPRGSVRIESGGSAPDFGHVAFHRPDGQYVLIVANPGTSSRDFRVKWNGQFLGATIPGESVVTYTWSPEV